MRQLRTEKELSLQELANKCDISISYLNEIEKGKKYPKANKLAIIAQALGVSYDWLVSLQLPPKLMPIAELFQSDLLTNLPLEIFGMEPSDLLDIVANTPTKMSAFISTLAEIARNYDISVESFYFSALRSYQEMHRNYFPEIETQVQAFVKENPLFKNIPYNLTGLKGVLIEKYQCEVIEFDFSNQAALQSLRSIVIPNKNQILINQALSDRQKMFALGREIGYRFMQIKERAYTASWIKIDSFEQLLNNFKASYFSGALLIPQAEIVRDLRAFITLPNWQDDRLLALLTKYQASPEMFAHRLTGIVPHFFGLNQLFFLRFNHQAQSGGFILDKELHLAGLYNPHGNMIHEDYCRRWISLNILKDLAENQSHPILCQAQRSQYIDSEREFLCISIAHTPTHKPETHSSVTIGFLMNAEFKKQVKFWEDKQVPIRKVGVTCQRCSASDCTDRIAPPHIHNQALQTKQMQASLEKFMKEWEKG